MVLPKMLAHTLWKNYTKCYFYRSLSTVISGRVVECLENILGPKNVSVSKATREQHACDEGPHRPFLPDIVTWPQSTEQVSQVAKYCFENDIPMVPYGTGTGLEQGVGAIKGGVCVDLSQMTNVINVHPEDFDATVEAGVTWRDLNTYLRDTGLWFPIDPGASASLGGMASTSASGTNAVKYGTMRENVLNLEVVLSDGTVIHTGGKNCRPKKSSAGYNLTNLFVGSEGTLGFITKVTLKLYAIPEMMVSAVCPFPDIKAAVDTTIQTLQANVPIARIELLDEMSVKASNLYNKMNQQETPTLFLEFHGSKQEVEAQAELVGEIAASNGGSDFQWATDTETRNQLWKARHSLFYACLALRPASRAVITDVCVPISKLPELVIETKKDIEASGLIGPIFGHAGDGNFHAVILFAPTDAKEKEAIHDVSHRMVKRSLDLGGTCTGEHGIGLGKVGALRDQFGDAGIQLMRQIKKAVDPKSLMNPGKLFEAQHQTWA